MEFKASARSSKSLASEAQKGKGASSESALFSQLPAVPGKMPETAAKMEALPIKFRKK